MEQSAVAEEEKETNEFVTKNISKLDAENSRLQQIFKQKQRQNEMMRQQINVYKGGNEGLSLYIERANMQRQPVWWYALTLLSFLCMFGAYTKQSYAGTVANVVSHKLLWRKLYVETNVVPTLISLCIILYTIFYI